MCGIFGWATSGKRPRHLRTVAAVLAVANEKRGNHSWGFWADGATAKGLGAITTMPPKSLDAMAGAGRLMAHTRHATTGQVTTANCHPFTHGNITGAHNGMVHNHSALNIAHKRAFAVDSQHIFAHLAEGLPLAEIQAYGAVEYHDSQDDTINLACFHGGELAVASNDHGLFWSSEPEALATALRMSGMECKQYEVEEHHHYFALPDGRDLWQAGTLDFSKPPRLLDWKSSGFVPADYPQRDPFARRWKDSLPGEEECQYCRIVDSLCPSCECCEECCLCDQAESELDRPALRFRP